MRKRSASFRVGAALVAASSLAALAGLALPFAADRFPAWDPERVRLAEGAVNRPPFSGPHLLGTDDAGRDCLARLLSGASRTIGAALSAALIAAAIGIPAGLAAALAGGAADRALMGGAAVAQAFPALVLAAAIVAALGSSLTNVAIAAGLVGAPLFARVCRARARVEMRLEYVAAARVLGASPFRILAREIWPNVLPYGVAMASLTAGTAVLEIAGLGFLGLGVEPGVPEWGTDVAANRHLFLTAPWTILVPGIATAMAALGFTLLGNTLSERGRQSS